MSKSHRPLETRSAERFYQIVLVDREGGRTNLSRHSSAFLAEIAKKLIPQINGIRVRIESATNLR